MYEVILITKEGCPSCLKAKAFFKARQKKITEIPHENPVPVNLQELIGDNFKTYPRIFIKQDLNIGVKEHYEKFHPENVSDTPYFVGGFSNLEYINFDTIMWANLEYNLKIFKINNPQLLGF